jgi:selenide,water dikinase
MGPGALAQVLRPLKGRFPAVLYPDLLVGLETGDDAAVYRLNDEQALIQTIDFFTPVVDDPYTYGAIAAVNAMSDVYAMGGEVLLALNVGAFPADLPPEMVSEILTGAADMVAAAGGVIAGGHTITDEEPKFGQVVTGLVHPDRVITKAGAQPGDVLVLTKPIGSGVITTAARNDAAEPQHLDGAVRWMKRLNRRAAQAMQKAGAHAATDVTGFGLLGHAAEMAELSGVSMRFRAEDIPLMDGALTYAEAGHVPGGSGRNWTYFDPVVSWKTGFSETIKRLLFDAQTSGGLLIALPSAHLPGMEEEMSAGDAPCWVVGEVEEGDGGITVV